MQDLDRIAQSHEIFGGRACIRGMPVTVGMIVGQILHQPHFRFETIDNDYKYSLPKRGSFCSRC